MRTDCSIRKQECITTSRTDTDSLVRLVSERFRSHARWFLFGAASALVTSLAVVSYGALIKFLGDALQVALVTAEVSFDQQLIWFPVLIVLASVLRAVSLYVMTLANNTGVQRALVDVSNAQFAALTDGDHARLAGDRSGGFVSRFLHDLNTLRDFGLQLANNVTKGILTIIGAFAAMLWMDWQLTLVLLIAYPVAFGPVKWLGDRVRQRAKRSQEQAGEVTSFLSESFQSARGVTAYGLEAYQKTRADENFRDRAQLYLNVLTNKAAVDPILEVAGGAAVAGVLAFSAWRIFTGAATVGDFLGFITLIGVAAPELRALGKFSALSQEARAATARFHELVDAPMSVIELPDARALETIKGAIKFENVHFAYDETEPVLNGISFAIEPGETVALVGASGAGKSTLFNLLLRLYDPDKGAISIDGVDIKALRLSILRGAMALVEQEPALFDDTIHANIALGKLDADATEIEAAAKAADADAFIRSLEAGYETRVGERGSYLSGGQRQRVALARAFLRDAPILLLDEATSALDAASDAVIETALKRYGTDRTMLIIAHRLSTVRWVDRILVLQDGEIRESGTHDTLLAAGGIYADFVKQELR